MILQQSLGHAWWYMLSIFVSHLPGAAVVVLPNAESPSKDMLFNSGSLVVKDAVKFLPPRVTMYMGHLSLCTRQQKRVGQDLHSCMLCATWTEE